MVALPKLPGADCANCPGRDQPMVPSRPAINQAQLAIIGERPTGREFDEGRPFVGGAGRLMLRGIRYLGLDGPDVHWTHAVPCKVRDKDLHKARKACSGRLTSELDQVSAPILMPLGGLGLKTVLRAKSAPLSTHRGTVTAQIQDVNDGGKWKLAVNGLSDLHYGDQSLIRYVCPTIHPLAAQRNPLLMPLLESDVERISRVLRNGWIPPERLAGRRIRYVRSMPALEEALHAMTGSAVGADVETVGLGPLETSLVCLALSDGPETAVIPWSRTTSGHRPWWPNGGKAVAAAVTEFLASRIAVTHNGPIFDQLVLERYGIRVAEWDDTLIASHSWESHLPKGLARVASSWLDVGPWKSWEHSKRLTDLWTYNARDTLYTILAWLAMTSTKG